MQHAQKKFYYTLSRPFLGGGRERKLCPAFESIVFCFAIERMMLFAAGRDDDSAEWTDGGFQFTFRGADHNRSDFCF